MRAVLTAAVFLYSSTTVADEPLVTRDTLQAFLNTEELVRARSRAIPLELKGAKQALGRAKAARDPQQIDDATKTVQRLEAESEHPMPIPTLELDRLKEGQIGQLLCIFPIDRQLVPATVFKILQIIDEESMIVEVGSRDTPPDDHNPLWVSQLSTKGLVDGKSVRIAGRYWEVVGTRRYRTAGGSNTIFEIRPFAINDAHAAAAKVRDKEFYQRVKKRK